MGEFIIKKEGGKEIVYERGIVDRKIGELHETLSGSKETRNVLGPKVKVDREGALSVDRKAEVDDMKGVFRKDFIDNYPTFKPGYKWVKHEKESYPEQVTESGNDSIRSANSSGLGKVGSSKPQGLGITEKLADHIGPIVGVLASCVAFSFAYRGMGQVAKYSLAWWLCLLVVIASIPGVIVFMFYFLLIGLAIIVILVVLQIFGVL